MRTLVILFIAMPLLACSQSPDLGFWADKQTVPCYTYQLQIDRSDISNLPVPITVTDCFGEEGLVIYYPSNVSPILRSVCSSTVPTSTSPLLLNVTMTGSCDDGEYIPCDSETDAAGQNEFPAEFISHIGNFQGNVSFHFTTGDVPDKVVVERMDGTVIYTTGWRGSTAYQSQLNAGLAARGLPPETIQGPSGLDGAEYTFNKNFADPTVRFKVYTSYWITGGSSWWVTVHCP